MLLTTISNADNLGRFWYTSGNGGGGADWWNPVPFVYSLDDVPLYWLFLLPCLPRIPSNKLPALNPHLQLFSGNKVYN